MANRATGKWHYQNPDILAMRIDAAEKAERKAQKEEEAKTKFQPVNGDVREDQKGKGPTNAEMMQRIEKATFGDTQEKRVEALRLEIISEEKEWDKRVEERTRESEEAIAESLALLD